MTEAIKAVIWRKENVTVDGKKLYKYLIGTILVTDEPIDGIDNDGDNVVMGEVDGENDITNALSRMEKFKPPNPLGNLSQAMLAISNMDPSELLREGEEAEDD